MTAGGRSYNLIYLVIWYLPSSQAGSGGPKVKVIIRLYINPISGSGKYEVICNDRNVEICILLYCSQLAVLIWRKTERNTYDYEWEELTLLVLMVVIIQHTPTLEDKKRLAKQTVINNCRSNFVQCITWPWWVDSKLININFTAVTMKMTLNYLVGNFFFHRPHR